MARNMPRLRAWLRPPRNLLIFFAVVVGLPTATLIVLGVRLIDQDRALARQRQVEIQDSAADGGVRVLEQRSRRNASAWKAHLVRQMMFPRVRRA